MSIIRKVLFVLFTLNISFFILSGCGYKPTTYYAKKELSGKIFVKLLVDLRDPKNIVLVKDAMNKLLIQKLGARLVNKESLADTVMHIKLNSIRMKELQYDSEGYNKLYRATVTLQLSYTKKHTKDTKTFTVHGSSDFSVDDTISDSKRFDAIFDASDDALNEILAKIALFYLKKSNS